MHLHLLTLLFTTTTLAHTTLSRPCPTYGGDPALCSNGISILPIIAHETLGKPCPTERGDMYGKPVGFEFIWDAAKTIIRNGNYCKIFICSRFSDGNFAKDIIRFSDDFSRSDIDEKS
ncbi:hypothetical protein M7I_7832 [Glarea lozoyensis 74030]|uniref:Uncharacterized protein n=1 Tax=Glarea lozoyensis (strain ATCC 74030 / MF5533) TaxID=1104152 RepID=H0EYD3_GLAL7|nr:hypothetical protein M7I_7832 [Glarea lozoyensis 74030]